MSDNSFARQGVEDQRSARGEYNALKYVVENLVGRVSTITLVRVEKVTNTPGTVGKIGRLNATPLVNQLDGKGNSTPHGVVNGLAYFRYQGGKNAVIIDPEPGDVGMMLVADRDVSAVKATGKQSNPGSRRRFDMADGIFIGLCSGNQVTPEQYIRFTADGIEIKDKSGNKMVMSSSGIAFTSTKLSNTGAIVAGQGGGDQVGLQTHTHNGVKSGPDHTNQPDPGT